MLYRGHFSNFPLDICQKIFFNYCDSVNVHIFYAPIMFNVYSPSV